MVMKNKILLIEPPFYRLHKDTYSLDRIPFGLAYLAGSILKNTAWDVKVYNADFIPSNERKKISYFTGKGFNNYYAKLNDRKSEIWNEIKEVIKEYEPTVIGVSVKSPTFISSLNVAKIAKEYNKDIKIIFGGPHPTMAKKDLLKNPLIDFSVLGEGEITIVELLKAIQDKKTPENVNGIIFRQNGEIIITQPREYIKDLDSLPFPHKVAKKVLHNFDKYPLSSFKYIFSSRGCPYNCHFCASKEVWTRAVRYRSVENVVEEIKSVRSLGVKRFHFDDDIFGVSKKYLLNLCEKITLKVPDIKWICETRADLIDDEVAAAMKRAGCETIQIGVESGNDKMLSLMGKNLKVEEILNASKIIRKHKIELRTFFLVGYPYETEETLKDTVNLMKKCKSDRILYNIFTPYPYTALYDFCKSKGLINDDYDPTIYNHQSPLNSFSLYIPPERFRVLSNRIERMIDRRNFVKRIRMIMTINGFSKLIQKLLIKTKINKVGKKSGDIYTVDEKTEFGELSI